MEWCGVVRGGAPQYFYKMVATAGSGCGEVGMKFSKQELLKFFELVTK